LIFSQSKARHKRTENPITRDEMPRRGAVARCSPRRDNAATQARAEIILKYPEAQGEGAWSAYC
jgi:hypothetical protein